MMELMQTVLWVGLLAWITSQVTPFMRSFLSLMERNLALRETVTQAKAKEPDSIPVDLMMSYVMVQSEGWARNDAEQNLREIYASVGNWDAVRKAVHPRAA